ncbi:methylglyoxal synthase [Pseudanabaena sp. FACHB-2040]|uniref:methylglyoxal synthase n=1 Tax=Pseudanabaena sp. FACHB-2040 TaxID=2692859 RepID=UPI001686866D|nr:methylglyoxal synthase [Pseudanabaena sp. FACHB-2040]MBD2256599.1 methylglyoxal synthase [Pseudanabaena sp. FACHB-2040]
MPIDIALLAHNGKKDDMVALVDHYRAILSRYRLVATQTTGQRIIEGTGMDVTCLAPGALGGDAQIAARIVEGQIGAVIFLIDPLYAQSHEPYVQTILRVCELHNVPLATNLATASAVITQFGKFRVGHLIYNPVSGQGNPDSDLALIRRLLEPQVQLNVVCTKAGVDPAAQAKAALEVGTDLVIASGGDGTVSAVAGAVMGTDIPLGVIARGTANAFATALGIPTDIQGACETILAGTTLEVDGARCNDQPMILLTGIGFEAGFVERANRDLKNRLGPLAYLLAGVQQFNETEIFQATIQIDGKETEVQPGAITIANAAPPTSVLAQGFGHVVFDDGLLDVTIATSQTRLQSFNALTSLFASALVNSPTNREDIICLRTAKIKVTTDPPQKVAVDGEIVGTTPIEVECLPKALTVFAPLSAMTS